MKKESDFPFERARRVTRSENHKLIQAISQPFVTKLRSRDLPAQDYDEKYELIYLKIPPKVLAWAMEESKKRGIGYQTVINEVLLERISRLRSPLPSEEKLRWCHNAFLPRY